MVRYQRVRGRTCVIHEPGFDHGLGCWGWGKPERAALRKLAFDANAMLFLYCMEMEMRDRHRLLSSTDYIFFKLHVQYSRMTRLSCFVVGFEQGHEPGLGKQSPPESLLRGIDRTDWKILLPFEKRKEYLPSE